MVVLGLSLLIEVAGLLYWPSSGYINCCSRAPYTFDFSETSGGHIDTQHPQWGGGLPCNDATQCKVINFTSNSASSGLTTQMFGLKLLQPNGSFVLHPWVMVLWKSDGQTPLATWNWTALSWTAAPGQTLPIGGLNGTRCMMVYLGTSLVGTGDMIQMFGVGSNSVSGGSSGGL